MSTFRARGSVNIPPATRALVLQRRYLDLIEGGDKTLEIRGSDCKNIPKIVFLTASQEIPRKITSAAIVHKTEELSDEKFFQPDYVRDHCVKSDDPTSPACGYKRKWGWRLSRVTKWSKPVPFTPAPGQVGICKVIEVSCNRNNCSALLFRGAVNDFKIPRGAGRSPRVFFEADMRKEKQIVPPSTKRVHVSQYEGRRVYSAYGGFECCDFTCPKCGLFVGIQVLCFDERNVLELEAKDQSRCLGSVLFCPEVVRRDVVRDPVTGRQIDDEE